MKDGSTREGKILDQTPTEVKIRIDELGMQATESIPLSDVAKITTGPIKLAPAPTPPATRPATQPIATNTNVTTRKTTTTSPSISTNASKLPATHGFFAELGNALIGMGPDDPRRLPPDLLALWKAAQQADVAGKRAAELDSLRSLEQAFASSPGGISRLDGISRHDRQQPFGLWMASVHWDILADGYHTGSFDLADVRDAERPALIGLLKEKTAPALEPLKTYFPPVDEKTGKSAPFKPAQLQGITADNDLDVKDKAELAHAILLAQIKLEPDMPPADKQLLYGQLTNVNHVLSRTAELEPQARAAALKKKLADEKAKRGG